MTQLGYRPVSHVAVAKTISAPINTIVGADTMPSPEPGADMRRRDFIAVLGGVAAGWPVVARAQQTIPVVGFLTSLGRNDRPNLAEAFRRGLSEAGYVDGRT
jgi:hypothetical protein